MRITINDIAKKLGVTAKTVSKALNNKGEISEDLKKKVLQTAVEMQYTPNKSAKALARREICIAVVYPLEPYEFYSYMLNGVKHAQKSLRDQKCDVHYYPYSSLNAHADLKSILSLLASRDMKYDGIVLTCSHKSIDYEAELKLIEARMIPVLYNTISGPRSNNVIGDVGLDSRMTGRIAAEYLGITARTDKPKVAIFVGQKNITVHSGCLAGLMEESVHYGLNIVGCYETHEKKACAAEVTKELLNNHPDINGIYVSSYNSVGVCETLEEFGMDKKIAVIGHDLYPELCEKMRLGSLNATIFQNQYEYGRESLNLLFEYIIKERTTDKCTKLHTPQLLLQCMADSIPQYLHYE